VLTKIQSDLEDIANLEPSLWQDLKGKRIFATGCTGFIGMWVIHSFLHINKKFNLGAELTLLTRNKKKLSEQFPELKFVEGDVKIFAFPKGKFDFVIHGATEVASFQAGDNPSELLDVSYVGTKRVVEFCHSSKASRILFLSSGACYGVAPVHVQEDFEGAPQTNSARSTYGAAKRIAEQLLFNEKDLETVSARIFAACGPFMPMESDFAFANFLKSKIQGQPIEIKGNGLTTRSYLYASDLTFWLWKLLLRGEKSQIYNVGSEVEVSIKDLATKMGRDVRVLGTTPEYTRYVPSTRKGQATLGLKQTVTIEESIERSFQFYKDSL
jgi:dTDP-glucose 4,6-dehydratase